MGLSLLADAFSGGIFKVPESSQAIINNYHFYHMMYLYFLEESELSQHKLKSLKKLSRDFAEYLQMKAYDCPSYAQITLALYNLIVNAGMPQVSPRKTKHNSPTADNTEE